MPDAVTLECPDCGAKLTPEPGADTVRCEYCGTTSKIDDCHPHAGANAAASAALEALRKARSVADASSEARLQKLREAQEKVAASRAKAVRNMAGVFVVVGLLVAAIAVFGGDLDNLVTSFNKTGHASLHRSHARRPDMGPTKPGELVQWDVIGPSQLGRIPGGHTVLLGLTRHLLHGKTHVIAQAFDATTLGPMWQSRPLGLWSDYQVIHARIAAGKAVLTDDHGQVLVDDLTTGHQMHSQFLTDQVQALCVPDPAKPLAWAQTRDGRGHQVDLDTGKVTDARRPAACPVGCIGKPVWAVENPKCRHLDVAPRVDGLQITDLLRDGASEAALGHRSKGTAVPMAAGFDTSTGKLRWKRTLPDGDAFAAQPNQTIGLATTGDGAAYLVLEMKEGPPKIIALDEATGRTRWAIPMPRGDHFGDEGDLRFGNGRLYFAHDVALDVLDAKTGKLLGSLGEL